MAFVTEPGSSQPKIALILVTGPTGSGKSSFINKASGSSFCVRDNLDSCTEKVKITEPFELDGRFVMLIDSPGFDDSSHTDIEVLTAISAHLSSSYERKEKLNGIIYMHRISDFRVSGTARQHFDMFRSLCGKDALQNVVIVTNMWGEVDPRVGEQREKELATSDKLFKPALDNKARMLRHDNTVESAQAILRHLIGKEPEALCIQKELVDERLAIAETAAGMELNKRLLKQAERHNKLIRNLEEQMEAAIKARNEEMKETLEDACRQLQAKVDQVENDAANLAKTYQDARAAVEERMKKIQADVEAERASADKRIRPMLAEITMTAEKLRLMEADAKKGRDAAAKNIRRLKAEVAMERAKVCAASQKMEAETEGRRVEAEEKARKLQKEVDVETAKEKAQETKEIRTMQADAGTERAPGDQTVPKMEEAAAEKARTRSRFSYAYTASAAVVANLLSTYGPRLGAWRQ